MIQVQYTKKNNQNLLEKGIDYEEKKGKIDNYKVFSALLKKDSTGI